MQLDLGLGAEYWQETRGPQSLTAEQETLRAAIDLVLSGHVLDPRFLTFQLGVHGALFRFDPAGGETGTNRPIGYSGNIRAFSNRLFSIEAMAARQTTETSGAATGAVAGTRTSNGATVRFRPRDFPNVMVRHYESLFEADDPTTYRDEEQTVNFLESRWRKGRFAAALEARVEERSYSGGRVLNDYDLGHLTLDYNRGGNNSFFTLLQASSSTTTVDGRENPSTTSLISRSVFTRQLDSGGRLTIRLDHQDAGFGDETAINDQLAAGLYRPLSKEFSLEAEASYLVGENSDGLDIRQPAVLLGLPWSRSKDTLHFAVTPRVTYTGRPVENDDADSRFGGSIYGSIRWYHGASNVVLDAEVLRNNLSIVPLGPGGGAGGGSLLAGLEKEHSWARFTVAHAFSPRFHMEGAGEYRTRTRVFQSTEADESEAIARLGLDWRALSFKTAFSSFDVTGGDLPRTRESLETNLAWQPRWWLRCYLRHRSEDSTDPVIASEYRLNEAGVELRYGKLMFFTRWRRDTTAYNGNEPYQNERIWVGFRRWFGMHFGERLQ